MMEEIINSSSSSPSSSSSSSESSSSTSSSSSTDVADMNLLNSSSSDDDLFFPKNVIKKRKISNFISDVVDKFDAEEFREHFRLYQETAQILIERYEESDFYKRKGIGYATDLVTSAKTQVYAFLWFAGNNCTYREVSIIFNMSISSIYRHIKNIINFIYEMSQHYIRFPESEEEKLKEAAKFEEISGIKGIIGCIDGSYIPIRTPANKIKSTYTNRHDGTSITMQGICNAETKFLDVSVGCPSKIHDARVFSFSEISDKLPKICGERYHVLGDSAYPLTPYLLTPFKDFGHLTENQKKYNKKHCQARVKIENTFGILKQRFRQLNVLNFHTVEVMSKFTLVVCVLHNICIDNNDEIFFSGDSITVPVNIPEVLNMSTLKSLGEIKRNAIVDSM